MTLLLTSPLLVSAGFSRGFSTREVDLQLGCDGYEENLARFAAAAGFDARALRQARQVHGARVIDAARYAPGDREEADALVGGGAEVVGVRVADCVPILVAERTGGRVAAIHAGWRGAVAGVIAAGIEALHAPPGASLIAAIGPCIGACCFEVGSDVGDAIARAVGDEAVIARTSGEKSFVDLRRAARLMLVRAGVSSDAIEDVAGCTRCEKSLFFSYRREGAGGGRHLAAIASSSVRTGAISSVRSAP
jgi:YfiH family protein